MGGPLHVPPEKQHGAAGPLETAGFDKAAAKVKSDVSHSLPRRDVHSGQPRLQHEPGKNIEHARADPRTPIVCMQIYMQVRRKMRALAGKMIPEMRHILKAGTERRILESPDEIAHDVPAIARDEQNVVFRSEKSAQPFFEKRVALRALGVGPRRRGKEDGLDPGDQPARFGLPAGHPLDTHTLQV